MWWWWVSTAALVLAVVYLSWLGARVNRLHARAGTAAAALDAALVRRAAATAVLAEQLTEAAPRYATDLYAAARAALDAEPERREEAENDLTLMLRKLPTPVPPVAAAWPDVITASRRVSLARQVHTDVVRDALAVRGRRVVRLFLLARRLGEPAYFDVDDPGLDGHPAAPSATAS